MRWRRVLLIRSGCRVQAGPGAGDNCPILALYSWCWAGHQEKTAIKPLTRGSLPRLQTRPAPPCVCIYSPAAGVTRGGGCKPPGRPAPQHRVRIISTFSSGFTWQAPPGPSRTRRGTAPCDRGKLRTQHRYLHTSTGVLQMI